MAVEKVKCIACGKIIYDDGVGDYIYIVRTEDGKDGFLCDSKCQTVWRNSK